MKLKVYYWKVTTCQIIREMSFISSSFEKAEEQLLCYCKSTDSYPIHYLGWKEVEDFEKEEPHE